MYREGDEIIDKRSGKRGFVVSVLPGGAEVNINGIYALRYNSEIQLAPIEPVVITREDLLALQHLAVEMNDRAWFEELSERMGASAICKQRTT